MHGSEEFSPVANSANNSFKQPHYDISNILKTEVIFYHLYTPLILRSATAPSINQSRLSCPKNLDPMSVGLGAGRWVWFRILLHSGNLQLML